MAEFVPNQPITDENGVVEVTFGNVVKPLPPGTHIFQLVVVDDLGVSSDPVTAQVVIQGKPVAVLSAPDKVALGLPFKLDATASTPKGKITKFIFTRIVKIT
ncbi:MAG: hypothetical protein QOJ02_4233 [Acidobacteriota bacterium]|jgi:hypothetical protein|nr:hypothetical protein [Acidobacteriota bacterium]